MKHRKEMNPDIFTQQPEKASCGAKVAVAVLTSDLRYFSIHLKARSQIQIGFSQLHLLTSFKETI